MKMKQSDFRIIEDALSFERGYVLNFSDRTFAEFFDEEFGVTIYQDKYDFNGQSKGKHLRAFIEVEDEATVCHVLRRLWEHRDTLKIGLVANTPPEVKERYFSMIARIESGAGTPSTDAIDRFKKDETLEELVASIERDIRANKPVAALDRLHTYCMKKFGHLLDERGIAWGREEPLHGRVGKYVKALSQDRDLRDVTLQIAKNAIGVFDKFNHVRNNQSLAHDNVLLDQAEARFIYDSITAILRFVKTIEANRFGA